MRPERALNLHGVARFWNKARTAEASEKGPGAEPPRLRDLEDWLDPPPPVPDTRRALTAADHRRIKGPQLPAAPAVEAPPRPPVQAVQKIASAPKKKRGARLKWGRNG